MSDGRYTSPRVWIGALLIIFGALFLLRNYEIFDFDIPRFLYQWESIFIMVGIVLLFTSRNKTPGIVFIAIGGFNLFPEMWPLLLIGIGGYILYRRNNHSISIHHGKVTEGAAGIEQRIGEDTIDEVSIFGGGNKVFQSQNFRGGKITAIFGGSEINLYDCKLADGIHEIDLTALFGGTTIIVPKDWKVEVDVVSIFGGFGDKRRKDPNISFQQNKTLLIKGTVIFGGGEVKN
ncbi:LiaI-LiaF-like domain-containing protein [Bacteroidota bacterium]